MKRHRSPYRGKARRKRHNQSKAGERGRRLLRLWRQAAEPEDLSGLHNATDTPRKAA